MTLKVTNFSFSATTFGVYKYFSFLLVCESKRNKNTLMEEKGNGKGEGVRKKGKTV